jgi:hypothetical protein
MRVHHTCKIFRASAHSVDMRAAHRAVDVIIFDSIDHLTRCSVAVMSAAPSTLSLYALAQNARARKLALLLACTHQRIIAQTKNSQHAFERLSLSCVELAPTLRLTKLDCIKATIGSSAQFAGSSCVRNCELVHCLLTNCGATIFLYLLLLVHTVQSYEWTAVCS